MPETNLISLLRGHGNGRKMFLSPSLIDCRERNFRLHDVCIIDGKEVAESIHIGGKVP